MQRIDVNLGSRSYPIFIGAGAMRLKEAIDQVIPARDVLVITNTTVGPLYSAALTQALAPRRCLEVSVPDGEMHKTLANVSRMLDVLIANRFARDSCVVALGGGVVGDMAGFAAACYQRGIPFVQVPTTLLAQVDSSVGGKTGVNHPGGKNLIGAFHQPSAVFADTETLGTLPDRELRAGLAEVIKYGLIVDGPFFDWLEANAAKLLARDTDALTHAIKRSCELKAEIVARDEREQGERALLNLGHTFGHAIESATNYATWLHGEAVGAGMLLAADMSQRLGWVSDADVARVEHVLRLFGLRTDVSELTADTLAEKMKIDKKVAAGRIRLVLLKAIGKSVVTGDYDDAALRETLRVRCG
ncbi:MAG TPA: 3-dehydroquinate synthase [Steroidobacteraceae bacterium]|nr:3-dehydroquinate synthase [Steroidobacteraceae bacterium]